MPGDHTDLVRRAMDAASRRDPAAFIAEVDPDFELQPLVSVWPRPYHGHDGVEQWLQDLAEVWDEFIVHPESFRELDGGAMLVLLRWQGRGKGTSTTIEGPSASIWRFRDRKVLSVHLYPDQARALDAFDG